LRGVLRVGRLLLAQQLLSKGNTNGTTGLRQQGETAAEQRGTQETSMQQAEQRAAMANDTWHRQHPLALRTQTTARRQTKRRSKHQASNIGGCCGQANKQQANQPNLYARVFSLRQLALAGQLGLRVVLALLVLRRHRERVSVVHMTSEHGEQRKPQTRRSHSTVRPAHQMGSGNHEQQTAQRKTTEGNSH
jgi:hypothetical protein